MTGFPACGRPSTCPVSHEPDAQARVFLALACASGLCSKDQGMIICRTPFRISFFGGGTDYPGWFRSHGGAVLAAAIDKYCYLTCRYLPPFFEHRIRLVYRKIETCASVEEIAHPVVREG